MIRNGLSRDFLLDSLKRLQTQDVHMALLGSNASYDSTTGVFQGHGEVRGRGYEPGGRPLTGFSCGADDTLRQVWCSWRDPDWQNATLRAHGAVIYAKGDGNRIICVLDFGEEMSSTNGLFRVRLPAPGSHDPIVSIAY